jgi:type II secretory pathway pseudopilin PulG
MMMNTRHLLKSVSGFSAAEMAMMLTVTTIVAGTLTPVIQDQVAEARYTRAIHDTHTLATAISRFEGDVLGQANKDRGWATFDLLVGAGSAPAVGAGGDAAWVAPAGTANVGLLDDQLVTNAAGYRSLPQRQSNPIRGWHGPYVETGIGADPWGHRYAINIKALSSGASCAVVVSAGPNGQIETAFNGQVILAGGDDVVALVAPAR